MQVEIPLVCKHCGSSDIYETGSFTITAEAWRKITASTDGSKTEVLEHSWETEPDFDLFDVQDEIMSVVYECLTCRREAKDVLDLLDTPYGKDPLGRLLDADGNPHGPPTIHPAQEALEIA